MGLFETPLRNLQELVTIARKAVYGIEVESKVKRFSNTLHIDLKKEGNGKGVRGFTVRNIGNRIMYISTTPIDEKEPLYPGESFSTNSQYRLCDQQVKIEFGAVYANNATPFTGKECIMRYLVEKC